MLATHSKAAIRRTRARLAAAGLLLACLALTAEALAQEASRTWTDATGAFRVEAVLVQQDEKSAQLRKADGRIVTVPIDRLSAADQQYLAARAPKPTDPFAGGVPAAAPLADASGDAAASPLTPDPGPPRPVFPVGVVSLPLPENTGDRLYELVVIDGDKGLVLATVLASPAPALQNEAPRSTSYLCDLGARAIAKTIAWDGGVRPIHYDAKRDVLVALTGVTGIGYAASLAGFSNVFEAEKPQPAWKTSLAPSGKVEPLSVQSVTCCDTFCIVAAGNVLYVYDTKAGAKMWQAEATTIQASPAISPGARYVAYQVKEEVKIVNASNGAGITSLSLPSQTAVYLGFSPDGMRLAASNVYGLGVYDLRLRQQLLQLGSSGPGYEPQWLSEDDLLLGGQALVRVPERLVTWRFNRPPGSWIQGIGMACGEQSVAYLAAAVTPKQLAVASERLPHAAVVNAVRGKGPEQYLAVPAGSPISVRVKMEGKSANAANGEVKEKIEQHVRSALERSGWKVVPKAPLELVAITREEAPRQVTYSSFGRTERGQVTVTPFSCMAQVQRGGQTLWERQSLDRPPTLIRVEQGETVQQAADRYNTPNLIFFQTLIVPAEIVKPEFAKGFGQSTLGVEGLQ